MCTKFKAVTHVIFDLDGTILDTEVVYEAAIRQIVEELGKTYTIELLQKVAGTIETDTCKIVCEELNLPITPEEFLIKFRAYSEGKLADVPFMPGVEKLVRHLHAKKIPIAIATSSTRKAVDIKSTNYKNFFALFSHIVCGSSDPEVKHGKPHPDIFHVCASKFADKPEPADCLVLEDAPNGVKGALAAGMQVVMIPIATVPYELWKDATLKLNSMEEFKPEQFGLPPYSSCCST